MARASSSRSTGSRTAPSARKRFWRGNFLFAQDPALGGPGFKRFRPIVRRQEPYVAAARPMPRSRRIRNTAIFSLDPSQLEVEDFYDRMDDVMSPAPLDPLRAMTEAITSLEEQVNARDVGRERARKYQSSGKGDASMPDGPAIFETTGAWEDFATPSRDLRLLIAMDVVRHFPDRVARRPGALCDADRQESVGRQGRAGTGLASELASRKFSYPAQRRLALDAGAQGRVGPRDGPGDGATNVNDCVELRWGAPEEQRGGRRPASGTHPRRNARR